MRGLIEESFQEGMWLYVEVTEISIYEGRLYGAFFLYAGHVAEQMG
jgi:hypothetical protein